MDRNRENLENPEKIEIFREIGDISSLVDPISLYHVFSENIGFRHHSDCFPTENTNFFRNMHFPQVGAHPGVTARPDDPTTTSIWSNFKKFGREM